MKDGLFEFSDLVDAIDTYRAAKDLGYECIGFDPTTRTAQYNDVSLKISRAKLNHIARNLPQSMEWAAQLAAERKALEEQKK